MKLSINRTKDDKPDITDPKFGWIEKYFDSESSLINSVKQYPYSTAIFNNGERLAKNVIGYHNIFIFDIDNKENYFSIQDMEKLMTEKEIKSIIITTKSHGTEKANGKDRYRLFVFCDGDLTKVSPDFYKFFTKTLSEYLEIENYCDLSCLNDSARLYHPSPTNALVKIIKGNITNILMDNAKSRFAKYKEKQISKIIHSDFDVSKHLFQYEYKLKKINLIEYLETLLKASVDSSETEVYDKYKRIKINGSVYLVDDYIVYDVETNESFNAITLCKKYNDNLDNILEKKYVGINIKLLENAFDSELPHSVNDKELTKNVIENLKKTCGLKSLYINIKNKNVIVNDELIPFQNFSENFRFKQIQHYKKCSGLE